MSHETSRSAADRSLLLAVLAVQMDLVGRDELIEGMNAWVLDKATPLGQILVERGRITLDALGSLDTLIDRHLERHGGDLRKCLDAIRSQGPFHLDLSAIADPEVQASLAGFGPAYPETIVPPTGDGPATSEGPARSAGTAGSWGPAPPSASLRFRKMRFLARGNLGEVYVAQDEELQREVALKEIQGTRADDPESRSKFLFEAAVTGGLEHPGIVPVYGLGVYPDGRPHYAMRLIRGESLQTAIQRFHQADEANRDAGERSLDLRKLLDRFVDVCNAVAYAHSERILHRDIKPANVMLGPYGETLVVDWGLAKIMGREETEPAVRTGLRRSSLETWGSSETLAGTAIGTPAYMSPEQALGDLPRVGPASDIYSLGATLYHLLTGKPPFQERDLETVLRQVQAGDFPPPRKIRPGVPAPLEAVCVKAMALQPEDRYPTARALAEEVERWLADEPVHAYPEPPRVRIWRWVRKHRTPVAAAAVALLTTLVGLLVVNGMQMRANAALARERDEARRARLVAVAERSRATEALHNETLARQETERQRDQVEQQRRLVLDRERQARHNLYLANLNLANQAWQEGNVARLMELLYATQPRTDQEDFRGFEWYYLWRACHRAVDTVRAHRSAITALCYSADGRLLFTGSADGVVKFWHLDQPGKKLAETQVESVPNFSVRAMAFSGNTRMHATGGSDGEIRLVSNKGTFIDLTGHKPGKWITDLAFSPDGRLLASSSLDDTVRLWDTDTGKQRRVLEVEPTLGFVGLELAHEDGQIVVKSVVPDSPAARAGSIKAGDRVESVSGPDGSLRKTAGMNLAAVLARVRGRPGTQVQVVVRSADRPELRQIELQREGNPGRTTGVKSVAFSPDGKRLAAAYNDWSVRLWSADTGDYLGSLGGATDFVNCVRFSPDGKLLAWASGDKAIRVVDAETLKLRTILQGHDSFVWRIAFSPDGKRLASASQDRSVRLWDLENFRPACSPLAHTAAIGMLAFAPDGKRLVSGCDDGTLRLWDLQEVQRPDLVRQHEAEIEVLAFSPDSRFFATGAYDGALKLWSASEARVITTLADRGFAVLALAFSPDGGVLVSAGGDSALRIWEVPAGNLIATLKGHRERIHGLAFSPDGQTIASASHDGTIRLWDLASRRTLQTIPSPLMRLLKKGPTGCVGAVAWSPDGKTLATGEEGHALQFWDAKSGAQRAAHYPSQSSLDRLAFSPDGKYLALGYRSGMLKLWDVAQQSDASSLFDHRDAVKFLGFSRDGKRLLAGSGDGVLTVWDMELREQVMKIRDPSAGSSAGALSPDGRLLAAGLHDGSLRLYHAATPEEVGRILMDLGHSEAAVIEWTKEISLGHDGAQIRLSRGLAYADQGDHQRALDDLEKAIELGASSAEAYYATTLLSLATSRLDRYRSLCERRLKDAGEDRDAESLNATAWACALGPSAVSDMAKVVRLAEKSASLDPSYNALNTLGAVLYRAGRFEEAVERLKAAIEKHGDEGTAFDHVFLAMALARLGRSSEAAAWRDKGKKWLGQAEAGELQDVYFPPPLQWSQHLELQVLLRECDSLLGDLSHSAPDPH